MGKVSIWLKQIRAPFLFLSVFLVLIGAATAHFEGERQWFHVALLMIGVIAAHISVNLFNEYSDYRTRIDEHTERSPFSGGSGMLQGGLTSARSVRVAAYIALFVAAVVGFYFCIISGWLIFIFMVIGGLAIRFYTSHLSHWLIGELTAGIALGSLVVLGCHFALSGHIPLYVIWISLPPGILTFLLLFLNEFPDTEADRQGGRHHLVIHFGRRISARIYVGALFFVYLTILAAPFLFDIPVIVLVALATLPVAVPALKIIRYHSQADKVTGIQALNVVIVLLTDLLLAVAFFVA